MIHLDDYDHTDRTGPLSALSSPLPSVRLERHRGRPLHRQLYRQVRRAILDGKLPPGTRLPATRTLADALDVSRNTVITAYAQLRVEGYVESRVGAGTFVAEALPEELLRPHPADAGDGDEDGPAPSLGRRGRRLAGRTDPPRRSPAGGPAFRPGEVAPEHFPYRTWWRLARRRWADESSALVSYGSPGGLQALRKALADYLAVARAVECDPEQVLVTSGSQHALYLTAQMLLDPGATAAMDEPGYPGARAALEAAGARVLPMPVDDDGPDPSALPDDDETPRLIYTTPSHQYPMGVTTTIARRLELLDRARGRGAWVVEDDYDSEFRYESRPLPALQGLGQRRRVVYVGTFSKILAPSLRVGYLVLPADLVEPFRNARRTLDQHPPVATQAVLADFIREGHLERHVRRMRSVYQERRDALLDSLGRELGGILELRPGGAGMHVTGRLPAGLDDAAVAREGEKLGLALSPLSAHYGGSPPDRGGLVLGFGAVPPEAMAPAAERLARAVERAGAQPPAGP